MAELARWLDNPLVLVGLCAIVGGALLCFVSWVFTNEYERGGRDSVHRRPRKPEPWHREPSGEFAAVPDTKVRARHRLDTVGERTTNLAAYARPIARARVSTTEAEGTTHAGEPTRLDHAGTSPRLREVEEAHEQEEGGADRERREDEGRPEGYGAEGGTDAEAARPVVFQNTITGEIVMMDGHGRRIEWSNGE